ncbi:hypothetical protein AWJ20_2424 [Sugiyamaella lignohabitans]|uniref:Rho-GAP domain-containing protein n=1 Tax=Sugiyamaella lignohabitans TaxID=796027 RepID=A0A167F486_9ASCO|nr:uncharacterized protein AWJ20_2424 [Sugiyamaella lignohabitans]ANB14812.1 hypothetical protein AWJ20_2424 [Sugiyamaella lignohabitans]
MHIQGIRNILQGKYFKKGRRPEMITDLDYQPLVSPRQSFSTIDLDTETINSSTTVSTSSNYTFRLKSKSNSLPCTCLSSSKNDPDAKYPVFSVPLDDAVKLNSEFPAVSFDASLCLAELQPHVPAIVLKLIEHITNHGLNEEGIYRISGSTAAMRRLKAKITKEGPTFDIDPNEFDIYTVTSTLKLFLRELPADIFNVWGPHQELRYVPEGYDWSTTNLPLPGEFTPHTSLSRNTTMSSVSTSIISAPATPDLGDVPELCSSSVDSQPATPESLRKVSLPIHLPSQLPSQLQTQLPSQLPETTETSDVDLLSFVRNELMQLRVSHFALLHALIRHLAKVAANSDTNRMSTPNLVVIFSATLRMHKRLLTELITRGDLTYADIPAPAIPSPDDEALAPPPLAVPIVPRETRIIRVEKITDEFTFAQRRNKRRSVIRSRATSFDFFDPSFLRPRVQT